MLWIGYGDLAYRRARKKLEAIGFEIERRVLWNPDDQLTYTEGKVEFFDRHPLLHQTRRVRRVR